VGTAPYDPGTGTARQKKKATKTMLLVTTASINKKDSVLPGNSQDDRQEKKNALSPNKASGIAVAVPRCVGQLRAAVVPHQLESSRNTNQTHPSSAHIRTSSNSQFPSTWKRNRAPRHSDIPAHSPLLLLISTSCSPPFPQKQSYLNESGSIPQTSI